MKRRQLRKRQMPVTSHEIWTFIGKMDASKSCGPYSVPVTILKTVRDYISEPLAFLVNDSFASGNFPDKLRTVPTIVTAHTFCASRDTRISYR